MPEVNDLDQIFLGVRNGLGVWVSQGALDQVGEKRIRRELGMVRMFPVKTDLSGNEVMVEARTQEKAVEKYLRSFKSIPLEAICKK